jgi:hexosaminidase
MQKLLLLFTYLSIFLTNIQAQYKCPILPHPQVFQSTGSFLELPDTIYLHPNLLPAQHVKAFLTLSKWYPVPVIARTYKESKAITFKKLQNAIPDSYSITVQKNVEITYSSDASLYYAFHSLLQLVEKTENGFQIPQCFISDYPKFAWRGLHLDVSRHFFSVDEIRKFLDLMAQYKFNRFHWHLTDDQGWRIEIKKYPKLTEIGAWRDSTVENHFTTSPRTYQKEKYGGFYTQEQIKEIVRYAAERHITVVPEIEMPGHSRALLAAYPEMGCTGQQMGVPGLWGVFDEILCSKPQTVQFMQDVLEEVLTLFPGEYIHIGGDEAPKNQWKKCPNCQSVIQENALKDEHELQSYFIRKMDEFLTSKSRKLIGWDEILEGGLSPNATVMSWRGEKGGIEAATQNHFVVMSPGSHCYFDHYQGKNRDEPLAIGGHTNLEKVYDYQPIPKELAKDKHHYILGAQGNLWTEYIPNWQQLEYMAFPRAIALSQVLWSENRLSYDDFLETLEKKHFPLLNLKNVNYSRSHLKPNILRWKTKKGIALKIVSRNEEETFDFVHQKKSIQTNEPFPVDAQDFKKEDFHIISQKTGIETRFEQLTHLGLGAKVAFNPQPSPNFSIEPLTLTDGVVGTLPWKGNEWVAFQEDTVEISLTFRKKIKANTLRIHFLKDESAWIHLPESVRLSTKRNGSWINQSCNHDQMNLFIPRKTKTIFLQIVSKPSIASGMPGEGNQPWLFVGELMPLNE